MSAANDSTSLDDVLSGFAAAVAQAVREGMAEGSASSGRHVAVFDGDGTLWDRDIGEAFLRWLIAGELLAAVDCKTDVYAEYERRVAINRVSGYAWAVQIMAGLHATAIERWSHQMAVAWPNYRPLMVRLLRALEASGVEVWLVSASAGVVIRAAGARVGIPPARCLGITSKVAHGVLTEEIVAPITCEHGKVEAIEAIIGDRPLLAFGDSMGDFAMLQHARRAIVVGEHAYPNRSLLAAAQERGWPVHLF